MGSVWLLLALSFNDIPNLGSSTELMVQHRIELLAEKKSLFFIPLIFKLETFSSPPFHWAFIGRAKPLVTNYFTSSSPMLRSLYWLKGHELCGIGLLQIFAWNRDKVLKGLQALLECWTNKAGVLIGNKKIQMKAENEALNVSIRPSRSTLPNYCSVRRIKHRLANETPNLPMN